MPEAWESAPIVSPAKQPEPWESAPIVSPAKQPEPWESAPIEVPRGRSRFGRFLHEAGQSGVFGLLGYAMTRDVEQPKTQREAKGFFDAGMAGYQNSVMSLASTGRLPDVVLNPEHAKWYEKVASMAGQVSGDLPATLLGGIAGLISGAPTGPGAVAVSGAGALAVPAAIRTALVQSYAKGEVTSTSDFLSRVSIVLKETNKNILSGAAMGYAGGRYTQAFMPAAQTPLQKTGVELGAATVEALTQPTVNAALEGRLPEPEEFLDAGVLIAGVRYARHVAGKVTTIYEKTGVPPAQVVADAKADPLLAQQLLPPEPPRVSWHDLSVEKKAEVSASIEASSKALADNPQAAVESYRALPETQDGRIVSGDAQRLLHEAYRENPNWGGGAFSDGPDHLLTQELKTLKAVRDFALDRAAAEGKDGVILVGGQGTGKTTLANELLAGDPRIGVVIDAPHLSADEIQSRVKNMQDRGIYPHIVLVDADPKVAFSRTLSRSNTEIRHVNPEFFVKAHDRAHKAVLEFAGRNPQGVAVQHAVNGAAGWQSLVGGDISGAGREALASIRKTQRLDAAALADLVKQTYIETKESGNVPADVARSIEATNEGFGAGRVPEDSGRAAGQGGEAELANRGSGGSPGSPDAAGGPLPSDVQPGAAEARGQVAVPDAYKPLAVQQAVLEAVPGLPQEVIKETFGPVIPIPGEPTPTTVNYIYIDTPDVVKGVLERVSQLNLEAIQKQRRGVVSWDQTQLEASKIVAELLGSPGDLFTPREPGTPAGAAELLARKHILVGAAEDVVAKAKELLKLGTNASPEHQAAFMASVDRLAMIQAEFLGARAEAGRALNILKETREMAQRAKQIQKVLEQFNKSPEELAAMMAELDNPAAVTKMAREAQKATVWDMIVEGWKASAVSGPITQVANVMGNTSFLAFRPAVDATAAAMGLITGRSERVRAVEPLARIVGDLQGVADGLKLAKIAFLEDAPGGKAEHKQAIPGKAGHVIRTPFRALAAGDALFRTMAERGELYSLAAREAVKEGHGVSTREFRERVAELVNNPTKEMAGQAAEVAARLVFNAPLGEKGRAVQQFVKAWHLELAVPFIATPGNVFKEMARLTPAAPIVAEWREAVAKGGPEAHKAFAEMALGTGLAALAGSLAIGGHLSGAGDPDPNKRRVQMASGWQPYSIKLGNTWYSYQRLQPLGTLLGLAADMAEVREHMNSGEQDQIPNILGAAFANSVTNQTFLQGFAQVVAAISHPERDMGRFLNSLAASTVPGALGQTAQVLDPYQREIKTMRDAIQNRIPLARESMPVKRDPYGEPVAGQERILGVTPLGTKEQSTDKVRTEAARLGIRVAPAPDYIRLPAAGTDIGKVNLTPEQRDVFGEVAGKVAHEQLSQIVNAPGWDQLPDLEKEKVFDLVFSRAREYGKAVALSDEQVRAETQRIVQELTTKMRAPGVE